MAHNFWVAALKGEELWRGGGAAVETEVGADAKAEEAEVAVTEHGEEEEGSNGWAESERE